MSIAVHEAGHYVTARALGFQDVRCVVYPRPEGRTHGRTWRLESGDATRELAVILAGGIAEQMRTGKAQWTAADEREAAQILERYPEHYRDTIRCAAATIARDALRERPELLDGIAERLDGGGCFP